MLQITLAMSGGAPARVLSTHVSASNAACYLLLCKCK